MVRHFFSNFGGINALAKNGNMYAKDSMEQEEIYSKVLRAGRRTYFFDVRSTKAGDYYLTITESKKFTHEDGSFHYKKHKIYLYKEDFEAFRENMDEMMDYIIENKGTEVISERHQSDFKRDASQDVENENASESIPAEDTPTSNFTEVDFDDI
ncbi:MAG: Uncharacterised protein [SAR116 cluster bacterium]|nr:MAG: Uncharacterised protein [SAR116 cluster bacterium]